MADDRPDSSSQEPFGGEVRLAPPKPVAWLRWFNYLVYLVTVVYLLANRSTDGPALVLITAGLLALWLAYFWLRRAPPEL
ncbi:MAG TPA: hypothetical protein VI789_03565 [Dehalococcoidia bacterium]|nr:hypothetical protein [Dehalococcoidia bacterium]